MVSSSEQEYVKNRYISNPNNPNSMESQDRIHQDEKYELNNLSQN